MRYNSGGELRTLVGERVVAGRVEPIEKKPLLHVHPGSLAFSVAAVGCNMRCGFCQNWSISQWPREHLPARLYAGDGAIQTRALAGRLPGEPVLPRAIVAAARHGGARSIAYTFTEPTIYFELALATAECARAAGLANVFVTNGYINPAPQRELAVVLDAANVDLKFFDDVSYRRLARARLVPVLDAIVRYAEAGVWIELTTLVIPGVNDSDAELTAMADFIRGLSPDIPWHLSRFHGAHDLNEVAPTPLATLKRAAEIGRAAGLHHIYLGNVPGLTVARGEPGEETWCPGCGQCLLCRRGHRLLENRLVGSCCPNCGLALAGIGLSNG